MENLFISSYHMDADGNAEMAFWIGGLKTKRCCFECQEFSKVVKIKTWRRRPIKSKSRKYNSSWRSYEAFYTLYLCEKCFSDINVVKKLPALDDKSASMLKKAMLSAVMQNVQ